MENVEVRKNKEGYGLNLNALIYSELLISNVSFLVTNQICRVLPWKDPDSTKRAIFGSGRLPALRLNRLQLRHHRG